MPRLHLNICLTDIPRDLIRHANGKAYINLNVNELREAPDERGNDHTISVYVPQDRRDAYPDRIYIGRGKLYTDQQASAPASAPAPVTDNDLPF